MSITSGTGGSGWRWVTRKRTTGNDDKKEAAKRTAVYEKIRLYFERLPASKYALDLAQYSITVCPPFAKFQGLVRLHLEFNHLTELPADLPDSIQFLTIYGNQLTTLPQLPRNLELLDASYNQLTSLAAFPPRLAHLNVYDNQLVRLPPWNHLPLVFVNVNKNQLKELPPFPATLRECWCDKNQLQTLPPFPDSLQRLAAEYNPITLLPWIPPSCEYVLVEYTVIFDVFCREQTCAVEIKRRLNLVARFRELYYLLKYKRRWLDLLWLQVRLPKIMRDNHPDRLRQALTEAGEGDIENMEVETVLATFAGSHIYVKKIT